MRCFALSSSLITLASHLYISATSLLGSFIMLLLVLVSTAPPSAASIPKLGLFYAFNICIIVLSLCLSAIVINVSKLGDKGCKVPRIVEKVSVEGFFF